MLLMRPSVPMFTSRLGAVFVTVVDEAHLGSQLGLQSVVLERQRRGSCNGLDELRLGVERAVVDDRGDARAVVLDDLDRPLARRSGSAARTWP